MEVEQLKNNTLHMAIDMSKKVNQMVTTSKLQISLADELDAEAIFEAQLLTSKVNGAEVDVQLPTVTEMVNVDKLITFVVSTVNAPPAFIDTPLTAVLLSVYEVESI